MFLKVPPTNWLELVFFVFGILSGNASPMDAALELLHAQGIVGLWFAPGPSTPDGKHVSTHATPKLNPMAHSSRIWSSPQPGRESTGRWGPKYFKCVICDLNTWHSQLVCTTSWYKPVGNSQNQVPSEFVKIRHNLSLL